MLLLRKDNNCNYPAFQSVSIYSNRRAAHAVVDKSCTAIHLTRTGWLIQLGEFADTLVWTGSLPNHHLYGKMPGFYQQSPHLFIHMISVFISTKKYSLVHSFCSASSSDILRLLVYCRALLLSVLVPPLHRSLSWARTSRECSRIFFNFNLLGFFISVQPCLYAFEERNSSQSSLYRIFFISVFSRLQILVFLENNILNWHLSGSTPGA